MFASSPVIMNRYAHKNMKLDCPNIDKKIFQFICDQAKGLSRNCARNSIHHLEKAFEIQAIDPEMSVFRAITAEEEAATAIFIALKEIGYNNAEKIEFKNHIHKQALCPFMQGVTKFIADFCVENDFPFGPKGTIDFREDDAGNNPRIIFTAQDGELVFLHPPLNFHIRTESGLYRFEHELNLVTSSRGRKEIYKHVKNLSNSRNKLIYATTEGIPKIIGGLEQELENRKKTVLFLLRAFSLIFPYKEKALFVQQAVDSFLFMLGKLELEIGKSA